MKFKLIGIACLAAILAIAGLQCSRRVSQPDLLAAELASAVIRARASLPRFRDRLERPQPTDHAYFLRARFVDKEKNTEYLWLNRVRINPAGFKAVVAESPVLIKSIRLGDEVTVPDAEVVDWTIVKDDGSREGNFTQGLEPSRH